MAVTVKMNEERPTIRLGRDPGMFGCVDIHFDDLSEATAALDILKRAVAEGHRHRTLSPQVTVNGASGFN